LNYNGIHSADTEYIDRIWNSESMWWGGAWRNDFSEWNTAV